MFQSLYNRIIALSASPRAPYALAAVAFAESSVFPIPPDVLLMPMALANPKRAWSFALICTIAPAARLGVAGVTTMDWSTTGPVPEPPEPLEHPANKRRKNAARA